MVLLSCAQLFGCAINSVISAKARTQQASYLATTVGWKEHSIHTTAFTLKAYGPQVQGKSKILTIYIEGDGLAWLSADMPSDNPTPINPTALKMALHAHKNYPVVYLARPCQFVFNKEAAGCQSAYWTNLRFSPLVINAMNQAVNDLKKYYHAKKIILIGYSGGGTIAALITAKRHDVIKLITVAAVLDLKQWVLQESLTPLYGSLDPADEWKNLVTISQMHWVGDKDTIVPKENAFAFANRFPLTKKPQIIVVPGFDHVCCWATDWIPS